MTPRERPGRDAVLNIAIGARRAPTESAMVSGLFAIAHALLDVADALHDRNDITRKDQDR